MQVPARQGCPITSPPSPLQLAQVREYNKNAEPLGVIAAHEELESEQEEGLTSDEGGWRPPPALTLPPASLPAREFPSFDWDGVLAAGILYWFCWVLAC